MTTDESVPWPIERGQELRRQARKQFGQGVILTGLDDESAEDYVRRSLATAASAYNWLEDTEYEDAAHADLHRYGRYARESLPDRCELGWNGRSYEHRCPVSIAHKRIGFSIGFTGQRFCSVCGQDVSECAHVPGQFYDVEGGRDGEGKCRVCLGEPCEVHVKGQTYRVRAHSQIRSASIVEVSLVDKPKQPDARLTAVPIDSLRLQEYLGPEFTLGMRVSCDQCLEPCPGVNRPFRDGAGGHG